VGPRAGLDGSGKSRPHRDSIPGPFHRDAIATTPKQPNIFSITAVFPVLSVGVDFLYWLNWCRGAGEVQRVVVGCRERGCWRFRRTGELYF
jgi:hypothetical protein